MWSLLSLPHPWMQKFPVGRKKEKDRKKRKNTSDTFSFTYWSQCFFHFWLHNGLQLVSAQIVSRDKPIESKWSSMLWAYISHSLPAWWQFIKTKSLEDVPRNGRNCIWLHNINVIWHLWQRQNSCFLFHVQGIPLKLVAITIHCIRYMDMKKGEIRAILVHHARVINSYSVFSVKQKMKEDEYREEEKYCTSWALRQIKWWTCCAQKYKSDKNNNKKDGGRIGKMNGNFLFKAAS